MTFTNISACGRNNSQGYSQMAYPVAVVTLKDTHKWLVQWL